MAWKKIEDKRKIRKIIEYLISNKIQITVNLGKEEAPYTSKLIKINMEGDVSSVRGIPDMVIEKLSPDQGNSFIQSVSNVNLEFSINGGLCRCVVTYLGISSTAPYFGFIVGFPEYLEIKEKRREERFAYEVPEFVTVEFTLEQGPRKGRVCNLNVIDCSGHGLGILVTQEDLDLIKLLNPGDKLKNVTFYATWAMIKVDGTVRHKTMIREGKYKGSYVIGIESPELIENCKPQKT